MLKIALNVLKKCLNIKKNEKVLIITDKNKTKIANILFNAAKKLTSEVVLVNIPVAELPSTEPPAKIASFMKKFDVILAPTSKSLTHTKATQNAAKTGARIATLPGITEKVFSQSLTADFKKVEKLTKKLYSKLKNAKKIKILTPSGTNIVLCPRRWVLDTGIIKKGSVGNIPAGEIFCAPLERKTDGVLVIDSMQDNGEVYAQKGTSVVIIDGKAAIIAGKSKLEHYFRTIKNSTNVAEFSIGTNYKAKIIGNILQDEKVLGTAHIAFGSNFDFGGRIKSGMHLDTILFKPTIYADKKVIMRKGIII